MTKLVISLFVVISYLAFNACIQENKLEEIPDLAGEACGDCSVGQYFVRSKLACSMSCLANARCVSFSYVKQNKHCTLRNYIPTTYDCGVSSNGDRHYRLIGRTVSSRYTYDATIGGWYRIECKAQTTWMEAQTTCRCEGGHLLIIRSQIDHDWILQKITQTQAELSCASSYWADGTRVSGTWRLYDGSTMSWSNIDGNHNGNCYRLDGHDMPCSDVYGYVCQKNVP